MIINYPWKKAVHDWSVSRKPCMLISRKHGSSGARRPKRKVYHRVFELDRAMELQKKPAMILRLVSLIQSQQNRTLRLRDLEKEVGIIAKWNLIAAIEKYPSIFYVGGGSTNRTPPYVTLSQKADEIASEECQARAMMEPLLVEKLRKLLMLTVDCRMPLEKIELVQKELGLPIDFKETFLLKYSHYFTVERFDGIECLNLHSWDSSLAVTAREAKLAGEGVPATNPSRKTAIGRDGNFAGPFAFKIRYASGFRPNASFLDALERWQRMEFPSPYLNARRFELEDPKARKRIIGVLHELLSLTMEKRMTVAQLDAFHKECLLPAKLLLCLVKQHGIFYVTNKGGRGTVILKEGYEGSQIIEKCPLQLFHDRFVALSGRREPI